MCVWIPLALGIPGSSSSLPPAPTLFPPGTAGLGLEGGYQVWRKLGGGREHEMGWWESWGVTVILLPLCFPIVKSAG